MEGSTFKTHPQLLQEILKESHKGLLQLPDFQRSWVWDEERIKSLIASISQSFPIGALMTLQAGSSVNFKPRLIQGVPTEVKCASHRALLLDGQQRITSIYQATLRNKIVITINPKNKRVKRWFYIDIRKALDSTQDREDAIVGVPEDKLIRNPIGRKIEIDLSTSQKEYTNFYFPLTRVFDWDDWQDGFDDYWQGDENLESRKLFRTFKRQVLEKFKLYQIPVIELDQATSKEAVCIVFEKVNTGGKPLDAFELITAMYAADGHELRKDWYGAEGTVGRHQRFVMTYRPADANTGIISNVSNTDFLHVISLFYTEKLRKNATLQGKKGKELPAISGNRKSLLNLPLSAYKEFEMIVEKGFISAAKFLHKLNIYRIKDLPYQSQVIPLAAILAKFGEDWEHETIRAKLVKWYWNGVFGELYGSSVDTRIARDFIEVVEWLNNGPEPTTVTESTFRPDRLKTMRMRLSAAYKGINVLLMNVGAKDFRTGQPFDQTIFFGENVDIHHIFPKDWCKNQQISSQVYDSIINKTPLSYRTNRKIGGSAPSKYLLELEDGNEKDPPIESDLLDSFLSTHLINPTFLRHDKFEQFMKDRQSRLLELIEIETGKRSYSGEYYEEGEDDEYDEDIIEAEFTIP